MLRQFSEIPPNPPFGKGGMEKRLSSPLCKRGGRGDFIIPERSKACVCRRELRPYLRNAVLSARVRKHCLILTAGPASRRSIASAFPRIGKAPVLGFAAAHSVAEAQWSLHKRGGYVIELGNAGTRQGSGADKPSTTDERVSQRRPVTSPEAAS
jgi:hypothetical protein